eukprot:TRINITY_DN11326_c0_g1_i1.p1 TRINITY_DN11326_c0_g1~~TRINITY_DN11326_c0_g1_i1.p1  ORF type:complete len:589 (+),score=182.64 TRINITY_DN11326_c0_g1_i1:86-1768(+)
MVVMRIDQLVASFLFGVVFWGLCAKMAVPPAQVVRTDSLSTVTSLELAEVKAWKDSLSTQLNEVTGTVRLLQLGRLHDKWLQAEQVRQTKEREVDTLEQELKTLPVRGSTRRREVGVSLLRARAAVLAQGIIRERLMEDMRAATFPNYHEEPDNSTTFVHRDLANDFDPSIPMLKRVEGVRMNANAYGVWAWKQGVNPHTANLVVIAADKPKQHTVELLLEGGYIVWKRHYHCPGECRELVSYLSYLADDTSPAKPMPKHIIFIHGHEESWHQPAPLLELIADGVECSNNTGAYVPLGHHGMPLGSAAYGTQDGRLVNTYVEHLGEFGVPRGKTLEGFCCAQFVVTPQLIKRNTMSFYKTFLEKKLELKVDGFLGEFAFGWIFGDPEVRAATGGPPAQCRKRREIAAPFVASSRSGMWTNPITKPRFTVVLGQRSANETENLEVVASLTRLLPDSANVWIRHESHWCSAGNWVGDHCCGPHRGYLSFMNTFKNDDVRTSNRPVSVAGSLRFASLGILSALRRESDLSNSRVFFSNEANGREKRAQTHRGLCLPSYRLSSP